MPLLSATALVRLIWGAVGLLSLAIGYMLVDAVLFLSTELGPPPLPVEGPAAPTRSASGQRSADIDLASLNLFGDPGAGPVETRETVRDAPETRLKITLIGVFVADRSEDSAAIIRDDRREALYRVGDRLPGNAILAEVHPDHVLLRRAGAPERLSFEQPQSRLLSVRQTGGPGRQGLVHDRSQAADITPTGEDDAGAGGTRDVPAASARRVRATLAGQSPPRNPAEPIRSAREFLEEYGERLADDPAETLAELGIEAVADGSGQGYRLGDVASPEQLSRVGLRPGDVVLSVNGQQLGNPQVDTALIDQVTEAGAARLEIQRGERRFFVTLSIPRN